MRRRFVTLDVFAATRFAGNPLAVVLDSEGLETPAMQAIAREFNLAETVFVMPPAEPFHRARLRIFTPAVELPFAGHPTVGTAVLLGRLDAGGTREVVLDEGIGEVRCVVEPIDADRGRASFDLPRLPESIGAIEDRVAIAAALGLAEEEIGFDRFVASCWSAGVKFAFIPLCSLDAVRRCGAVLANWNAIEAHAGGAFVFCRETIEKGHAFHARMFAPSFGIPEDPATGSAAAAFAGVLATYEKLGDGEQTFRIEQGYEMGRPSLIELSLSVRGGKLASAAIAGEAIVVSEGTIEA